VDEISNDLMAVQMAPFGSSILGTITYNTINHKKKWRNIKCMIRTSHVPTNDWETSLGIRGILGREERELAIRQFLGINC